VTSFSFKFKLLYALGTALSANAVIFYTFFLAGATCFKPTNLNQTFLLRC